MARRFRVDFDVSVYILVEEEALERVTKDPEWPYPGMTKSDGIEMLARCMGIYGKPIEYLDGWADLSSENNKSQELYIDLDSWEELTDGI